ncbi:MAG TPA: tetratricopeptide repeat protein [Saprospiraceae bacterium]|nr:tetratricopeptide repeat protein [Saprospiraceae bacterium]
MKTKSFKLYSLGAGLLLVLIVSAYWAKSDADTKAFSIPQLLDRNERIMLGQEWDEVQRRYVSLRNQLTANTNDHKAATALAYLFIKEARITGEHGHYYPAAQAVLDHILENKTLDNEDRFNALVTKAGVQLSLHDFNAALNTGQTALALNPYNAQIYGVLVDCHVELGQYQKAVLLADQMVAIRPDLRSYSRVSYLREIFGDIDGAKKAMLMAIQAGYPGQEETAWAMHTYAEMLMRYGYNQEARMVYESILQERPNYPFAIAGLGKLAIKANDFNEAESRLKDAIDIVPEVDFYVTLANLYKKQKKTAQCEKLKKEILAMLEDDTQSGHNMDLEYAHVYNELFSDTKTALQYAAKELKKRPLNIDVNRTIAMLEVEGMDLKNARLHYQAATATQSKHPDLELIKAKI